MLYFSVDQQQIFKKRDWEWGSGGAAEGQDTHSWLCILKISASSISQLGYSTVQAARSQLWVHVAGNMNRNCLSEGQLDKTCQSLKHNAFRSAGLCVRTFVKGRLADLCLFYLYIWMFAT